MRVAKGWGVLALVALMGCGGVAVEEPEGVEETALASQQEEVLDAEEVTSLHARHEQGEMHWVRVAEGPATQSARAVAHDRQGNAYVVMLFFDGIDLGETSFTAERGTVLVKYSRQGRLVWARLFEGFFPVESLAVDDRGNILLATRLFDPYDLGDGTLPPGLSVVKLDKKGRFVWSRSVAVLDGVTHLGEVAVDRWGNVLLAGALLGSADFGEGPVSSGEDRAAFVAKYDARGRFEWLYLRDADSWGDGIALDDRGNAFLIGSTTRPELGQRFRTAFLLKLSRHGEPRWTGHVPLGGFTDVAIGDNRVLVSGIFRGSFSFAGETVSSEEVPGVFDADGYVLAWSLKGEERWGRNFGETADVLATD